MVDMSKLNDAELMRNLRERFKELRSYCNCGITLVAMNTYRWPSKDPEFFKPGMYAAELHSKETMDHYLAQTQREHGKPHAWNLASHCHKAPTLTLTFQPQNQPQHSDSTRLDLKVVFWPCRPHCEGVSNLMMKHA